MCERAWLALGTPPGMIDTPVALTFMQCLWDKMNFLRSRAKNRAFSNAFYMFANIGRLATHNSAANIINYIHTRKK